MNQYEATPMKLRYSCIMTVLRNAQGPLTSGQICKEYAGQYNTSDIGSTSQILNVLALAGIVEKIQVPRSTKTFSYAYRILKSNP